MQPFPAFCYKASSRTRWEIIKACWDEYAVTQICAPFGQRPIKRHSSPRSRRRGRAQIIKAYRLHSNLEQMTAEIYGVYGDLLKFDSYHLGNMVGLGLTLDDLPKTKCSGGPRHWFEPYFDKLKQACADIAANYGKWTDRSAF